ALDGNLDTWWEAAPGHADAALTLELPQEVTFDVVSLQEAVDHRSQRVESFVIDTWNGSEWIPAEHIESDELTTIGHKRLVRLKSPITTNQVRIRITGSRLEPTIAQIGLFKQTTDMLPPKISERASNGSVTLSNANGSSIVYTVDGATPTAKSPVYSSPIPMASGGVVKAANLQLHGQIGLAAEKQFTGLMANDWKIVSVDSEETTRGNNAAINALDGNSSTYWHTRWDGDLTLPHSITVDMGTSHRIAGFTYLPRQDGMPNGVVEKYRFETSTDGVNWATAIESGMFANIRNNPSLQQVTFSPVDARFFRFTSLQTVNKDGWTCAAEISVLPAQ
ncbi:MAG: discoidin domain-containing protein, partial [Capsulimonas sp.]|uniref:discoidin domain-containing protein n=1 Tax=Capsulimonas sp. TaxID=2494211 RepID=UPI003267CD90